MKLKATKISKTRAAGLAAATRGRTRQFADRADLLEASFRKAFPLTPLTRLGTVEAGTGLARDLADGEPIKVRGFGHFA